jgi:hypothetical protein
MLAMLRFDRVDARSVFVFPVVVMFPFQSGRDRESNMPSLRDRHAHHANEHARALSRTCGETVAIMWARPATS